MYSSRKEMPLREVLSSKNLSIIGVPRLFHEFEISDFEGDLEVRSMMTKYVDNIHEMFDDCVNITLFGSNGNGKTFLTSLVLKNAYRNHYSARRITFSSYIGLNFGKKTDEVSLAIQKAHEAEFLVIDEIGKEVSLQSGANIVLLEELMKYREEKGFPTLICTNLNLGDLKLKYGNTISSLISQSVKIEMNGGDERSFRFSKRRGVDIIVGEEE